MRNARRYVGLVLILAAVRFSMAAGVSAADAIPENGWYTTEQGYQRYYKNGECVKGWKKIDGYWHYFKTTNGNMRKNVIVRARTGSGYCFLGPDGIVCTDRNVQKAVNIIRAHSKAGDSKAKRLKAVYLWLEKKTRYRACGEKLTAANIPAIAKIYLDNKYGECIVITCGFEYIPIAFGLKTRIATGTEGSKTNRHTWPEIKSGSTWYIYDLQREVNPVHKNNSWYKVKNGANYSRYRTEKYFVPTVKNGKVTWKQVKA